ncbi:MAG UNVERIFIED_CONTAM: DUF1549 domain-containing protein [Planctomycetaceae bacterium]|jgi:hypothetical protein
MAEEPAALLRVYPATVELTDARDWQRLLVLQQNPDGSTLDITDSAVFSVDVEGLVLIESGVVKPQSDGVGRIRVQAAGLTAELPLQVMHADIVPDLNFRSEVLATLTKAGCNSGKCHGSASGKDGFRLSLFGYDPAGDQYRLTREIPGRRVNPGSPADSLLIRKALGEVNHTGGQCIQEGSEFHQTLLTWIENGAPADAETAAVPTGIRVYPEEAVFARAGGTQQLLVMASFSDGTDRDVTELSVFLSNNDAAATVTAEGAVSADGLGSAFIMARFDQFTEGTAVIVRPGTTYEFPQVEAVNEIDRLVFARWQALHLLPSELCSDETFLRRVYLDLTGLLPSAEERQEFLNNPDPARRTALVDRLMQRPDFTDLWVMRWAELLQIRSANGVSPKGLLLYDRWLRERVHAGVTIDQIVQELLPATGGTFENPAAGYYQTETTPQLLAENIAQSFLGTRIQCAQCHNHPFDRWTMDDYYGFAAFFSQVGYKQAPDPREIMVFNAAAGELRHPLDNRVVKPAFLGAGAAEIPAGADYRAIAAEWLASPANPAFARNLGNVVWSHFFGVGIVDPVDDFRVSNPPSNPALLGYLGHRLEQDGYDIRPLVREICLSRTYQLSTERNDSNRLDERHFSHGKVRRLRAEVLLDCLNQVTETSEEFRGLPPGSRAIQIPDGPSPNYFLTTFGRSTRATACSCEVKTSPTLSQALHLLNGESTGGRIESGGVVERLLKQYADPLDAAAALYERCLCRRPTTAESTEIRRRLEVEPNQTSQLLTDLFWALLNSNEFIFNH